MNTKKKSAFRIPHSAFGRRGSILMQTTFLVFLASIGALIMSQTLIDHQHVNNRRRDLARALYAAEAGIALVQHWSNFPGDYTSNPTMFLRGTDTPDFTQLRAALATGGFTINGATLKTLGEAQFTSDQGYDVSHLEKIDILPPQAGDPVPCMLKIVATGRGALGVSRVVTAYANESLLFNVKLPAGLISFNVASAQGNARVHWGQSWSKGVFNMLNKSQMDYLVAGSFGFDQWAKYRTESWISFPTNWKWGSGKDLFNPFSQTPGAAPASGDYAGAFEQYLPPGTLQWPSFDYQTFKEMALAHGRYYGTDSSGNIYRNGIKDSAHRISFLSEFGVPNRDTAPYDLVFIDTTNGNPPAADGSNMATISASGNSLGLKGVFWIGANFDGGGCGSPPFILDAEDPAGNPPPGGKLSNIFLEGVLYGAGTVAMSGNCGVYGSVVAQRGFAGGGTPDIYYNHKLGDEGLPLNNGNVGSNLTIALEKAI